MKKRLLAVLLSVAMLLSVMPFSAFATDAAADNTATGAITVPADGEGVVSIDGENFYVYDADDFARKTFTATFASEGTTADAVAGTKYIAVRIKIDDDNAAYVLQNSRFAVYVNIAGEKYRLDTYQQHEADVVLGEDGSIDAAATNTNVVTNRKNAANYFVDYKDASLSKFFNTGGVNFNSEGIETTNDVDGIMLFPISNNEAITEEALAAGFEGLTIEFIDREGIGNSKFSNWDNKTVYIGDIAFVDDQYALYDAAVAGKTKYNLNNGGNATVFTKIGPFRSFYRHGGTNTKVGSGLGDLSATDTNVHVTKFANGDRAVALTYTKDTSVVPYYTLEQLDAGTSPVNAPYAFYVMDSYNDSFAVNNSQLRKKGAPTDAEGNYVIDLEDSQYIAFRMAITGGNENAWVMWNVSNVVVNSVGLALQAGDYQFIDINSGEIQTHKLSSSRFTTTGSIDGYLIIPFANLATSAGVTYKPEEALANIEFMQLSLTRGFYDGKTLYAGDSFFINDVEEFRKSVCPPEIKVEATDSSITITNATEDMEFSFNGGEWGTATTFTDLTKETKYTISARYTGFTAVNTVDAWTTPYSTHTGDTASYFMNVYDEPGYMLGSNSGNGVNSPIHYASNVFARTSAGVYGNNQRIYIKEFNGETFIEFDMDEAKLTGNQQIRVYFNAFEDLAKTSQLGMADIVDTSNMTALAYRLKVTGGTKGVASKLNICFGNGLFGLSNLTKNGAYFIDYATRTIVDPVENGLAVFTDEFDGWFVVPFDCINNSCKLENAPSVKDIILGDVVGKNLTDNTGVRDIQFIFQHNGDSTDWTNRNLYVGDVLAVEDTETFNTVRTSCEVVGHEYTSVVTPPTCTEEGYTTYTCKYCDNVVVSDYVDPTGHDYEATVTEPDCMNGGYTTYVCLNGCGSEYVDDYTDVADHAWEVVEEQAPTCDEPGYIYKECPVCGEAVEEYPEALGHSYEAVVTPPTATEEGYTTYTCTVCGDSFTDDIVPPTGEVTNAINLKAEATDTNIVVTWDAVEGADRYNYYLKNSAGETLVTRSLAADKTSMTLAWPTDIEWGETYSIGIRPHTTKWLDTVYVESALVLGDRIVDIKTESVGRTIKVSWQAYEGATQYYVYVYEKGAYPTSFSAIKAETNEVTIINAIYAEVDYEVRVVATKGVPKMLTANAIPVAARLNVFSPDAFIERGITPNSVAVAWDQIRGVDKVWVYLNRADGTGTEIIREAKGSYVGVYNLTVNTEYTVAIQARIVDADGIAHYSGKSEILGTIKTGDWEDIMFKAVGTDAGAEITWNAHTNAVAYYLYRSTNGGKTFKRIANITDGSTSYADATAKNGYQYAIQVQVKDDLVASKGALIKSEAIVK